MDFHKEYLDLFLVPSGLLMMLAYHLFLLYRHQNHPDTTIFGLENKEKRDWVQEVVGGGEKDFDRAINVISSNTTVATFLATISLTLTSLIGTWLGSASSNSIFYSNRVYGDTRPFTIFIKIICLCSCFLLGFSGFVQAARHMVHANYLMSSPDNKNLQRKIEFAITKGADFLTFGLRALYFALNILLWFFGPIPMFFSSIVMVIILYYHDIYTVALHNIYCTPNGQKGRTASLIASFSY